METIEIEDVDGDIDDDTILRFIEYAYTGDYTVPEPDIVQLSTDSQELERAFTVNSDDPWGFSSVKKSKKKSSRKALLVESNTPHQEAGLTGHDLQEAFTRRDRQDEYLALEPQNPGPVLHLKNLDRSRRHLWEQFCSQALVTERPAWQPRDNNDEREDYTDVFLCHARLYKFSDRYVCKKLMDLTLQKLRLTLSKYKVYTERVSDIVELIRYTYAHTLDEGQDALRALVLDFAVCYFQDLVKYPPFLELLGEGGFLATDLVVEIAKMVP